MRQSEPTETANVGCRILVADDDLNVRLLTRQCLEAEGMSVVEAAGPDANG